MNILNILRQHTKADPITGRQLALKLGLDGSHMVRKEVNALRQKGEPIASNSKGYWMAESPDDIIATIEDLRHRQSGMRNAERGLIIALENMNTLPMFEG